MIEDLSGAMDKIATETVKRSTEAELADMAYQYLYLTMENLNTDNEVADFAKKHDVNIKEYLLP